MSENKSKEKELIALVLADVSTGKTDKEVAEIHGISRQKVTSIRKRHSTPSGVGDAVEKVLDAVKPVTNVVKRVLFKDGEDCGCDERRVKLNRMFNRGVNCMTEKQHSDWSVIRDKPTLTLSDRVAMSKMHAAIFSHAYLLPCTCSPSTYVQWKADIEKVYGEYQDKQ